MFVNIYFSQMERNLNDAHLLQNILAKLESKERMIIAIFPDQQGAESCLSLDIPGNHHEQIRQKALDQVRGWIREFKSKGLQFDRRRVFK